MNDVKLALLGSPGAGKSGGWARSFLRNTSHFKAANFTALGSIITIFIQNEVICEQF